jgi:K+-transporting ATPase KdpF subunit
MTASLFAVSGVDNAVGLVLGVAVVVYLVVVLVAPERFR